MKNTNKLANAKLFVHGSEKDWERWIEQDVVEQVLYAIWEMERLMTDESLDARTDIQQASWKLHGVKISHEDGNISTENAINRMHKVALMIAEEVEKVS